MKKNLSARNQELQENKKSIEDDYFFRSEFQTMPPGYDTDSSESPTKQSLSHSVISINEQNKDIFHKRLINTNNEARVLNMMNQNH